MNKDLDFSWLEEYDIMCENLIEVVRQEIHINLEISEDENGLTIYHKQVPFHTARTYKELSTYLSALIDGIQLTKHQLIDFLF